MFDIPGANAVADALRWKADLLRSGVSAAFDPDRRDVAADDRGMLSEVRLIGGGLVMVLVIVLVLTEVWDAIAPSTDADGNYEGPFGTVFDSIESTGPAALTLLVVGFLVIAATGIMRYFGGGFGSTR